MSSDGCRNSLTIASARDRVLGAITTVAVIVCAIASTMVIVPSTASAGIPFVDGVSDQSMATWDEGLGSSPFRELFHSFWVQRPPIHITLGRYVVQWDVSRAPASTHYLARYEAWLRTAAELGLTVDISVTNYLEASEEPKSLSEYRSYLNQDLEIANRIVHPSYVEPWNEPNNQGLPPGTSATAFAATAANYEREAYNTCKALLTIKCQIVGGNYEDTKDKTTGAAEEATYVKDVESAHTLPPFWGVHPYATVEYFTNWAAGKPEPLEALVKKLPGGLSATNVWITEVAARACTDFGGNRVNFTQAEQASKAHYLTTTVVGQSYIQHAFYFEVLDGNRRNPSEDCSTGGSDSALYLPSGDTNAWDAPRPAASQVYNGRQFPWAYTGPALSVGHTTATLSASIYPEEVDTKYHFNYGTTPSYGSSTGSADAGASGGYTPGILEIGGLEPGTTYHYDVVAESAEGASPPTADATFTTPETPPESSRAVVRSEQTGEQWVYVRASNGQLWQEYWTGSTWQMGLLGGAVAAGTQPTAVRDPATGKQLIFYVNAGSGALMDFYWNGSSWIHEELGGQVAPNSSPTAIRSAGGTWVYYVDATSHQIVQRFYNNGWEYGVVKEANGAIGEAASGTSPVAILNPSTGEVWVYYVDRATSEVKSWAYVNHEWLNGTMGSGTVAANSSPVVVREPTTGFQWVYYVDAVTKHVMQDFWSGSWSTQPIGEAAVRANTSPTVTRDLESRKIFVSYVASSGMIAQYEYNGVNAWVPWTIGGAAVEAGSPYAPSVYALEYPGNGVQWVYFSDASTGFLDQAYGQAGSWQLGSPGYHAAPGSGVSTVKTNGGSEIWTFYVDAFSHSVMEWHYNGSSWTNTNLGGTAAPNTTPSAVRDPNNGGLWVFYVSSSGELRQLFFNGHSWEDGGMGHNAAAGTSPTAIEGTYPQFWVYYVDASTHAIAQEYYNGTAWEQGIIRSSGGALGEAAANTTPSVVRDPSTGWIWVYYAAGGTRDITSWTWVGNEWINSTMTAGGVPGVAAENSSPSVVREQQAGQQWVYYVDSATKQVHQFYWNTSAWSHEALTAIDAEVGASPTAVRDPSSGNIWNYFVANNREVGSWYFSGSAWQPSLIGVYAAPGGFIGVDREPSSGQQWVYYVDGGIGSVMQLYWNGTSWAAQPL